MRASTMLAHGVLSPVVFGGGHCHYVHACVCVCVCVCLCGSAPVTTAPAPLCHAPSGSVNCAASGKSSGNTSCCVVAGYTLGCCAPE